MRSPSQPKPEWSVECQNRVVRLLTLLMGIGCIALAAFLWRRAQPAASLFYRGAGVGDAEGTGNMRIRSGLVAVLGVVLIVGSVV
jgi:hypothetical protein